jgi:hypothetical protein
MMLERLLPAQQQLPDQPQRRLHHQLLGQLGPVHHELDPGHRDPVRRRRKYDQAVTYFKSGAGNGSIGTPCRICTATSDGYALGQWQESGRDQGHTVLGMGQLGAICEMAWNQGDDLYGTTATAS